MSIELERKLKAEAREKGFKGKRFNRYVYGTLRKTGWVPSHQKSSSHSNPGQKKHHSSKKKQGRNWTKIKCGKK